MLGSDYMSSSVSPDDLQRLQKENEALRKNIVELQDKYFSLQENYAVVKRFGARFAPMGDILAIICERITRKVRR